MLPMRHKTREPVLSDEQKRFLLTNHKSLSIQLLAKKFKITEKQVQTQCSRMYCSYFNEGEI